MEFLLERKSSLFSQCQIYCRGHEHQKPSAMIASCVRSVDAAVIPSYCLENRDSGSGL